MRARRGERGPEMANFVSSEPQNGHFRPQNGGAPLPPPPPTRNKMAVPASAPRAPKSAAFRPPKRGFLPQNRRFPPQNPPLSAASPHPLRHTASKRGFWGQKRRFWSRGERLPGLSAGSRAFKRGFSSPKWDIFVVKRQNPRPERKLLAINVL